MNVASAPLKLGAAPQEPVAQSAPVAAKSSAILQQEILFIASGVVLLMAIVSADILLGSRFGMQLFYLVPIAWLAWQVGRIPALAMAVTATLARSGVRIAEQLQGGGLVSELVWSIGTELVFFLIFAGLLLQVRRQLDVERALARCDGLTKLANVRAFDLALAAERGRLVRYHRVVSVVYFDLDNFKEVNDRFGHSVGDELLALIGALVSSGIRQVDTGARLGGDEFALILPETGATGAAMVAQRLSHNIAGAARERDWPVTCSMGVVTFESAPATIEAMTRTADAAMYRAKFGGKNRIETEVWE